ncbi:MAG: DUF1223 domain-containing protein [Alphaproteobacteria bacterium]|jgi:hypothetical protein|uniref:DUF1223 domain-containing protein n=1 Tax=Methyloceanibacter sp. TaxID=1965321 RepID=UPI00356A8650
MRLVTLLAALVGAACTAALLALAFSVPSRAEKPKLATDTPVLIELFTSQGCSSCPPADALLNEYRDKPGVITLSFSVDYWNYLGWHDTLSSAENSERQRDYALARGDGAVYTPQVVVDGITHVNGANEAAIEMAMRQTTRRLSDVKVPMSMRAEGKSLVVDIADAPETSDMREATIWLAVAKDQETVAIDRGENRGKEITYSHPVRDFTPIGMWKGEKMSLRLPLKDLQTIGGDCLVAMLQVEGSGPVLGAAAYERD